MTNWLDVLGVAAGAVGVDTTSAGAEGAGVGLETSGAVLAAGDAMVSVRGAAGVAGAVAASGAGAETGAGVVWVGTGVTAILAGLGVSAGLSGERKKNTAPTASKITAATAPPPMSMSWERNPAGFSRRTTRCKGSEEAVPGVETSVAGGLPSVRWRWAFLRASLIRLMGLIG